MFVSSMLKKCINLLSHDFSKSILKKEIHNDGSGRVSLEPEEVVVYEENKNEDFVDAEESGILNDHNRNCVEMEIQRCEELNSFINNNNPTPLGDGVIDTDIKIGDVGEQETLTFDPQQDTILSVHDENCDEILTAKWNEFAIECTGIIRNNIDEIVNVGDLEEVENKLLSLIQEDGVTSSTHIELPPKYDTANVAPIVDYNFELSNGTEFIIHSEQEKANVQLTEDGANHNANISGTTSVIKNDCTHERSLSENSLFNISETCTENVNDSNFVTFIQPIDTLQNTVFFTSEFCLANDIECKKFQESLHYLNCEKHTEVFGDQNNQAGNITQNLRVTADSDITNTINADVDDNCGSQNIDCSTLVECEIPITDNIDHDTLVTEESGFKSVGLDQNPTNIETIKQVSKGSANTTTINENRNSKTMVDLNEKNMNLEEEIADLKLQLNASQQVRAGLELQLTQKEEIIIKSQTEALRKQQSYKQEIKQLKDKLDEKNSEEDNTPIKELQETNKSLKLREAKLLSELNARKNDEQNYRKIMDEFEKTIGTQVSELQKLNEEHSVVKRHLATLELAFSDVLQKYDRSKKIIEGFKCNEEALRQSLEASEDNIVKSEQKYESLKAHAKAQIEKCNQEILLMREQYDSEIHKLTAIVKRLEIKNASLTDSLDQKNKECSALAALCDEVTGKV